MTSLVFSCVLTSTFIGRCSGPWRCIRHAR
jgi:hypothetical protein